MKMPFAGNILIIGNGAVSKCLQTLLHKNFEFDFSKITIIDRQYFQTKDVPLAHYGAHFKQNELTQDNYRTVLNHYLKSGDLLIDLGFSIESMDLIEWCQGHNVLFLNSSVEWWPLEEHQFMQQGHSVYEKYNTLFSRAPAWKGNKPTAIVDHGANPGLVNHWVKQGLHDIALQYIKKNPTDITAQRLQKALQDNNFPRLAMLTGTKVIQVCERDGQQLFNKKQPNEFINTWSVYAFHEEAIAPSEIAWGSHEQKIPSFARPHKTGPQHKLFLNKRAMDVRAQSWVPSGPIVGIVVRHGEVYSMGHYFSVHDNHTLQYRPTVFYVYLPSQAAYESLQESQKNNYKLHDNVRIVNNEISHGIDELGVLLLGHHLNGWWVGSELSIERTRELAPGQNATTLQVAAGLFGALCWMFENPNKGFNMPDDLPYDYIIDKTKPFLGNFSSRHVTWQPQKMKQLEDQEALWQFEHFLVN